jgi:hypothetical protein
MENKMTDEIKAAIALLEGAGYTGTEFLTPPKPVKWDDYIPAIEAFYKASNDRDILGFEPDNSEEAHIHGLIAAMPHMPRKKLTDKFLQRHCLAIIDAWHSTKSDPSPAKALRNAINEAMS